MCCGFSLAATGSLIFGIMCAISTAIASLAYLGTIFAVNINPKNAKDYYPSRNLPTSVLSAINVYLVILIVKFLVDFVFSVILCKGICEKNAGYVRSYFTYGVVMVTLGILLDLLAFTRNWQSGLTVLISLSVYCLILLMIRVALKEMTAGEVHQCSHKLDNDA